MVWTLYGEDVYVGYRYFDKLSLAPLFPFGHGLSYTVFCLSDLSVTSTSSTEVNISLKIRNTGVRDGAEVEQIYISPVKPRINRPPKELKGFKKVFMQAGEVVQVQTKLYVRRCTRYWDEYSSRWSSEAGDYSVLVGCSSGTDTKFLGIIISI